MEGKIAALSTFFRATAMSSKIAKKTTVSSKPINLYAKKAAPVKKGKKPVSSSESSSEDEPPKKKTAMKKGKKPVSSSESSSEDEPPKKKAAKKGKKPVSSSESSSEDEPPKKKAAKKAKKPVSSSESSSESEDEPPKKKAAKKAKKPVSSSDEDEIAIEHVLKSHVTREDVSSDGFKMLAEEIAASRAVNEKILQALTSIIAKMELRENVDEKDEPDEVHEEPANGFGRLDKFAYRPVKLAGSSSFTKEFPGDDNDDDEVHEERAVADELASINA